MELFESEGKRNYENFEKLNHHQSKLETLLDARLSILDISVVRITALENIANEIKYELKEINDFLIDLQNIKVDVKTFEEKTVEQYTDTRRLRIQVDDVTTQMKTLENFCEKYIPLQTQNAISKTMHGFIGPTQKARLEDYEIEIFTELHNVVLNDDGQPDLSDEKEKIINEINEKLAKLQEVYKERHLVSGPLEARKDNEGEGEVPVEEQAVDEDDMVELFKLQFHKINEVLDTLPLKFRTIDERVEENFVKCQEKADIKLKQLEGHLNELTVDIEDQKEKNNTDKKFMKSQVELVQNDFEDFKTTYEAKTQIITSLAGATSCIIEATCIKAFLEDSRTEQRENEIVRRSQLKNFTIENSLPSLNGDPTWVTMNTIKN